MHKDLTLLLQYSFSCGTDLIPKIHPQQKIEQCNCITSFFHCVCLSINSDVAISVVLVFFTLHGMSAGSAVAQPLIADPETEPYKYDIQRLAIYNLIPGSTASIEDKIQGKQVQV